MIFEFLKIFMGNKKDNLTRPILLKVGVALFISIGGIVYTFYRTKIIYSPPSKPPSPSPGHVKSDELGGDDCILQDSSFQKVSSNHFISSGQQIGDNDFLLPKFNDLMKDGEHEREIRSLLTRVKTLEEREKNLEIQMLDYYGVKEHDSVLMELKSQLKLNNIEGKLYNIKMESLISSNKRLESQLIDYTSMVTELEASRVKIKGLRKKLKSEVEHNRDQILALQDKVGKMKDEEKKAVDIRQELEIVVMEREGLKVELEEMKDVNRDSKLEFAGLKQKLDYVKMLATNALENEEVVEHREERRRLEKQHEKLTEEIERLKVSRSKDVEELAYLRWRNTYLRQELSNYQAGSSRTPVKTLSPSSEEKSKPHLTPTNANEENSTEYMSDLGSGHWSPSQISCLSDMGEHDEMTFIPKWSPNQSNTSIKPKMLAKLKKLLKGKGNIQAQSKNSQKSPLERAVSVDVFTGNLSTDFLFNQSMNSSGASSASRRSFDIPRSYSVWENNNCSSRTVESGDQEWTLGVEPQQEDDHNEAKSELLKYAEALKKGHSKMFQRRSSMQFLDLLGDTV